MLIKHKRIQTNSKEICATRASSLVHVFFCKTIIFVYAALSTYHALLFTELVKQKDV